MTVSEWMDQYSDLYDEDAAFHIYRNVGSDEDSSVVDRELTPEEGIDKDAVIRQYGDWLVVDRDVSVRTDVALYLFPSRVNIKVKLADQDDDPVNHPSHYTRGGIECIDAIKASMSPEAFRGFLQGNAMKHIWRHSFKGKPVEDLEKAMWYLTRLRNEIKP